MSGRDEAGTRSPLVLYEAEYGRTLIECRFEGQTLWLTQAQIAELFATMPQNVTIHLKAIYAEGELAEALKAIEEMAKQGATPRKSNRKAKRKGKS